MVRGWDGEMQVGEQGIDEQSANGDKGNMEL